MSDNCGSCTSRREIGGKYRCTYLPPVALRGINTADSQFPIVHTDWCCDQHSNIRSANGSGSSDSLRANLGDVSAVIGVVTLPSISGVKMNDYFRVIVPGNFLSQDVAVGNLIVALKDDPTTTDANDWRIV